MAPEDFTNTPAATEVAPHPEGAPDQEFLPETKPVTAKSNGQVIWDAIVDLSNQERHINRKSLSEATGLKPQIVDDHVERLILHGKLRRLGYGVLEVVEQFPAPRPISKTVMPNGLVKLEVDDVLLELTPKEARTLAGMFSAEAQFSRDVALGDHSLVRIDELTLKMDNLNRLGTALLGAVKPQKNPGRQPNSGPHRD